MLGNLTIRARLVAVLSGVSVLSAGVTAWLGYRTARSALEEESFERLTAVREMKGAQVEDYVRQIADQIVTFSEDRMVIDAMRSFAAAFPRLEQDLGGAAGEREARDLALRRYYETEFLQRLSRNAAAPPTATAYWPDDPAARALQHQYIAANPFETGSKAALDAAADNTAYSAVHRQYHPIFRHFLERFGYYDLFLIDQATGHIVYSVFKEVDVGTSLLTGPYRDTNFAAAFLAARDAGVAAFVRLVDFRPYDASYGARASFIASPIFDGGRQVGVLAFQMPVDRINDIMTSRQAWSEVGLGTTGETYIVGEDYTVRNQPRFLIEDREAYLAQIAEAGVPVDVVRTIGSLNQAIGLQPARTEGTEAALSGNAGTALFPDYRGVPVLSAYRPLRVPDVHWAIMSEIDAAEAFAPARALRNQVLLWLVAIVVGIGLVATWFARTLTRPIQELSDRATALATGDLAREVPVRGHDEIGALARSFETMRRSLAELVRRQDHAIDALSTPLIPLRHDVVLMPLLGEMDERRLERIRHALVEGLHRRAARAVILDLTGLPALDEGAARALARAARAARLLGVHVVLTGMQAETARQLVELDVQFDGIQTERSLQDGILVVERAVARGPRPDLEGAD